MKNSEDFELNDVIDYKQVKDALKRKKLLIIVLTASSMLLGFLYTISRKPTWEGQFQIVIAKKEKQPINNKSLSLSTANLPKLVGKTQLKTEVEILKSPSVLMPIFKEFVSYKKDNGLDKEADLSYLEWLQDNFKIKLIRGSEVLNISYYDNDKKLILSVLEKVSKAYQSYSNKNRDREIELALNYLRKQVKIFKDRSINSLREVQRYALQNSIPINDFRSNDNSKRNDEFKDNNRIEVINKKKIFRQYLLDIQKSNDSLISDAYVRATVLNLNNDGLLNTLNQVEQSELRLALLKERFQSNDRQILKLQEEQKALKFFLKENLKKFLIAELSRLEIILSSISIPEEVLLKFKELVRESERDNLLLSNLDAKYQETLLRKAENIDPWQLITKPTLLDKPIAPRKLRIMAVSTFLGLSIGIIYSLISYNFSNTIYNFDYIKQKYGWKLIQDLSSFDQKQINLNCELLANSYLFASNKKSISFLKCGELNNSNYDIFASSMKKLFSNKNFKITENVFLASESEIIIILYSLSKIKKNEIDIINNQLNLLGKNVDGFVII